MFSQNMKLRGTVKMEDDGSLTFNGKLYDNSPLSVPNVGSHDIELNESFLVSKRTVNGWLFVVKEAQQGDRCSITLPKPNIQYGHRVAVSQYELMPLDATLSQMGAKNETKGRVPLSKNPSPEEVRTKVLSQVEIKRESGKKTKKTA